MSMESAETLEALLVSGNGLGLLRQLASTDSKPLSAAEHNHLIVFNSLHKIHSDCFLIIAIIFSSVILCLFVLIPLQLLPIQFGDYQNHD